MYSVRVLPVTEALMYSHTNDCLLYYTALRIFYSDSAPFEDKSCTLTLDKHINETQLAKESGFSLRTVGRYSRKFPTAILITDTTIAPLPTTTLTAFTESLVNLPKTLSPSESNDCFRLFLYFFYNCYRFQFFAVTVDKIAKDLHMRIQKASNYIEILRMIGFLRVHRDFYYSKEKTFARQYLMNFYCYPMELANLPWMKNHVFR
jgi:hypothetical protein